MKLPASIALREGPRKERPARSTSDAVRKATSVALEDGDAFAMELLEVGLASAVRFEEAEQLALCDAEVDAAQGDDAAEALAEALGSGSASFATGRDVSDGGCLAPSWRDQLARRDRHTFVHEQRHDAIPWELRSSHAAPGSPSQPPPSWREMPSAIARSSWASVATPVRRICSLMPTTTTM